MNLQNPVVKPSRHMLKLCSSPTPRRPYCAAQDGNSLRTTFGALYEVQYEIVASLEDLAATERETVEFVQSGSPTRQTESLD